jgi:hypothetical protein
MDMYWEVYPQPSFDYTPFSTKHWRQIRCNRDMYGIPSSRLLSSNQGVNLVTRTIVGSSALVIPM